MVKIFFFLNLMIIVAISLSLTAQDRGTLQNHQREIFDVQKIFNDERLPNVVTALDGSIVAIWGWNNVRVRRSEDGGKTWGKEIFIGKGLHSGGAIVDTTNGDILVFTEDAHPPAPLHMFRSKDHGKTWSEEEIRIRPDSRGNVPSMCMNEKGLTLQFGKHKGRLIRPARVYAGGNETRFWHLHYTSAIYSDDGGYTWQASEPFPVFGTGEAAIEELSDGTLYYNSRRHQSTDGRSPRWRYTAISTDGGHTWVDEKVSRVLPDGNQHSDYGLMAGLVRLPLDGQDVLLFSNIDVPKKQTDPDLPFDSRWAERIRGTIWVSFDGGNSWPVKKLVDEGSFAYSSLTVGIPGTSSEGLIYLFYESEGTGKMAVFNLDWVTDGKDLKELLAAETN